MAEISADSEISADRGPAVLVRLPRSRGPRRTAHLVEIPGLIAPRKVVAAEAVAIAALRHLAAVHRMAEVVRRMAEVVRLTAADPTAAAEDTADSPNRDAKDLR